MEEEEPALLALPGGDFMKRFSSFFVEEEPPTTELSVAFAAAGRRRKTIVRVVLRGRTPDTGIPAALVATERRHNCFEPELPRLGGNPGKAQLCLLTIKHKTSFSTDYLRNNQGRLVHEEAPPI